MRGLARRRVRGPVPVRHREDVVPAPFDGLVADGRDTLAVDHQEDRVGRRAPRLGRATLGQPPGMAIERRDRGRGFRRNGGARLCCIRFYLFLDFAPLVDLVHRRGQRRHRSTRNIALNRHFVSGKALAAVVSCVLNTKADG